MSARTITLKFAGTCRDCGADLPAGTRARWYGRGRVYGLTCHERSTSGGTGKMVWWGGQRVRGTRCEDAPCCGCCGPGSDDPAYQPYEPDYDR